MPFRLLFVLQVVVCFSVVGQDIQLYELWDYSPDVLSKNAFVSLSDSYSYSEHPDSMAFDLASRRDNENIAPKYFSLNKKEAFDFLGQVEINEDDGLFIYSLYYDTIFNVALVELPLVAHLSHYTEASRGVSQYDYHIGLEFSMDLIAADFVKLMSQPVLVSISKENPFQLGEMEFIKWQEIPNIDFPKLPASAKYNNFVYEVEEAYCFVDDEFEYYLSGFTYSQYLSYRHLKVVDHENQELIFESYYHSSEGAYLLPLNYTKAAADEGVLYQWVGAVFKGKPTAITGFVSHSFGCPIIECISREKEEIRVRCDNRH